MGWSKVIVELLNDKKIIKNMEEKEYGIKYE